MSWDDSRRMIAAFVALMVAATLAAPASMSAAAEELLDVIVRARPGASAAPEAIVESSGGEVVRRIAVIDGFHARVTDDGVRRLVRAPEVLAVTPDVSVALSGRGGGGSPTGDDLGDLGNVAAMIKSNQLVGTGYDGTGVDVALIDSGVAPVDGIVTSGKVVNGPDLSFESQSDETMYLDTFGHGTHMAGIIAGRSSDASRSRKGGWSGSFVGIAPGARIVSVKVANRVGATDVSQILAAIDWVVQHRSSNGMNIRVLNLSFGTNPLQGYVLDPLSYAAEVAWRNGIFVVVSAGNQGNERGQLNNPAYNPRIFAVGANVTQGTYEVTDDEIPAWSSLGDGTRNPDVVAPGKSIKSLRVPGSFLEQSHPEAIDGAYFRGSGTSQSAAVVSGVAANVISLRPSITPDQLKKLLRSNAVELPAADSRGQGAGLINLHGIDTIPVPSTSESAQSFTFATGLGSLELARGGSTIEMGGVKLTGERDIFGKIWSPGTWATASLNGTSWVGGAWNGASWSGASWSGASWSGASWSGARWSGASWSGASWSSGSWSGARWSGASWSGARWSGASWS